jgi:peptidoglycan/xylan/chitin deacetylase (PgdA/CDA1 family)
MPDLITPLLGKLRRAARHFVGRDRPIILMYHRVARLAHDPWQLAVSPDRFAEQIEALVQCRHVVPLPWLVARLAQGRVPRKVAVVTFDDGYADVLGEARPVLERHTCPATVFLVTGAIGDNCGFWWDELTRLVFEPPSLPLELEIEIAGRPHGWRTGGRLANAANDGVRDGLVVTREQLHNELWRLLRPLDLESRSDLLLGLSAWAGVGVETKSMHRPLSAEEVHRLVAPGFIDIGAHTVTHPQLSLLDDAGQRAEIEGSRRACEELVGRPIDTFAYPFGDFDDSAAASVHDCGLACACTAQGGAVARQIDPMRLPRFGVGNWRGDDLARRLTAHS